MRAATGNLLGSYLKDRRTKLDPAAFGVTLKRRRTPGLRREEVAQRANVSATWYTWLEQGRGGAPSAGVLERLARALMLKPRILLVDEPSVGLAPQLVARTIDAIKLLKDHYQLTVLMAEQNFTQAIRIADRGYVIVHGKIAFEGRSANELNNNDLVRRLYMGM